MSHPGSLSSPAEFSLPLDAARARARRLREEAIGEFYESLAAAVVAVVRRLVASLRPAAARRSPRPVARPAR
jgi:hypothetical protein